MKILGSITSCAFKQLKTTCYNGAPDKDFGDGTRVGVTKQQHLTLSNLRRENDEFPAIPLRMFVIHFNEVFCEIDEFPAITLNNVRDTF